MKNLEKELQCHYFSDKSSCEECRFSVEIVTEIGSYLAIDLEHAEYSVFLNCIPEYIQFLNNKFLLVGVISTEEKPNDKKFHAAYTRRIHDDWLKRLSTEKNVKLSKRFI